MIVAQTEIMRDDRTLSAIGTGFAIRSITLRAPSSGEITEFNIAPGRRFAEDDTLMRLDDADERFAVSLAQARFDRASDERDRYPPVARQWRCGDRPSGTGADGFSGGPD